MEISTANGRIDLALPSGTVVELKRLGDRAERRLLHQNSADSPDEIFAAPMRLLTNRFVDATAGDTIDGPTLEREAHIRAVWQAIERAAQSGARERVAGEGEWD